MPISRKGKKMVEMLHADCMDYMRGLPDKAFDLAIVDPPYGIGEDGGSHKHRATPNKAWKNPRPVGYAKKEWDNATPSAKYFSELFRVSKNQIIWGGNYFVLPVSPCWLVWYKAGQNPNTDFSDCELAWASFKTSVRFFNFPWIGFGAVNAGEFRIHPTQKPVALYKWLLSRYAKPGDRILDTHGGSGSICIACHDLGFDLTWTELDADYYSAACKRYKEHAAQAVLFEPQEIRQKTYNNEFDLTS
jgi:site-specific DNA-methyltransferase (adenine-specific)